MEQQTGLPRRVKKFGVIGLVLLAGNIYSYGQNTAPQPVQSADAMTTAVHELQEEVRELRNAVVELRSEAGQYRAETEQLRRQLDATRSSGGAPSVAPDTAAAAESLNPTQPAPGEGRLEDRWLTLEESSQLLNSKIDDQYQTKIESASKYRMRLSGIVLLNVFGNHGSVDNQDFPTWAIPASANLPTMALGASLRQSEIGLEVSVRRLAGAKTSGNLQVDFSGGFTDTPGGVNFGLVRMRIASLRMDWTEYVGRSGSGQCFYFPTFADLVRLAGSAGVRLCRQFVGMDSAGARRTSLCSQEWAKPSRYKAA